MYTMCREAGINFFDTAWVYNGGKSEELLEKFSAHERDAVFIATKCAQQDGGGHADRATILSHVEDSRKRLKTDCFDMLYLHMWDNNTPLEETYDTLAELHQQGRFRYLGVSNYAAWQVMKAKRVAEERGLTIDAFQPMYNLVKRQVEVEILPMAQSEGIAIFPYSPMGGGLLSGKYAAGETGRIAIDKMYNARYAQSWMHDCAANLAKLGEEVGVSSAMLAVAWVARNPAVTAPIISGRTPEQLQASLDAIGFEMDDALYERVSALSPRPAPATDRLEEA